MRRRQQLVVFLVLVGLSWLVVLGASIILNRVFHERQLASFYAERQEFEEQILVAVRKLEDDPRPDPLEIAETKRAFHTRLMELLNEPRPDLPALLSLPVVVVALVLSLLSFVFAFRKPPLSS